MGGIRFQKAMPNRRHREHANRVDRTGLACRKFGLFNLKAKFAVDSTYFVIDKIAR
jgi:hypothetical protein